MKLELRNVQKHFGKQRVLCDLELACTDGEVVVVRGHNGSGKSTLLRLVAGILEPDGGHIRIDEHELSGGGVAARRRLGYVPDSSELLPDLLVSELCALVATLKQAEPPAAALLERLGVTPFWSQRLSTLSFGQRKRAYFATALIGHPWLLVLDEPTNGLDPEGARMVLELIEERKQAGRATLLATNDEGLADRLAGALAGRLYRLADGRLVG